MEIDKVFNNDVDGVADNLFSAVKNSVSEIKAMQQRKAAENVQLVIRALKKLETELRETNEDVANQLALRIASIKDGRDGKDGKNGKDGRDGKTGLNGKDGNKGDKGADGRDGVDGVDGISVVNANIDFDGSLVITLSDGRELNVGEVVAPDLAERIKVISTMSTNGAIAVKEEGTTLTSGVKSLNFVGSNITATTSGDDVTVTVSSGSGTVTSVAATGGTGISVSGSPITTTGTLTITNTAPDQTVALTQGGTTTITGTYPNFTISSADQFSGTVTSVAATVPTFLSVTGSPVTTSGTLAISLSGTALPVANGGTGITAFGTGVATALGVNTGASGAFVVNGGALGTPSSGTVTNLTGTASININGTVGATTPAAGTFTSLSDSGNLTFTGTGNRITGDFSNATVTNRALLQSSTTNGNTNIGVLPNGTSAVSTVNLFNNSDPTNSSLFNVLVNATEVSLRSSIAGTGTYFPMTFYTGGSERARIDTSGNVLIGSSTANAKLYSYATSGTTTTLGRFEAAIGSYTGTSLIAANTLGSSSAYNLFSCITDSDGDAGGPFTQFLVRGDGNVGIGTSSPSYRLEVKGASATAGQLSIHDGTGDTVTSGNNAGSLLFQARDSSVRTIAEIDGVHTTTNGTGGAMVFQTRISDVLAEAMRIDSSGQLILKRTAAVNAATLVCSATQNTRAVSFVNNNNNNEVGYIFLNNDGTTTQYASSSDYRLKENIVPMTDALSVVAQLKPVKYKWKINGADGQGFIAHELQAVVPDCVTGEKDGVETYIDEDGNKQVRPKYQGIDTSFLVATLTAAIQEQQALITSLTARITALENK